jgi:hypothetical protein
MSAIEVGIKCIVDVVARCGMVMVEVCQRRGYENTFLNDVGVGIDEFVVKFAEGTEITPEIGIHTFINKLGLK